MESQSNENEDEINDTLEVQINDDSNDESDNESDEKSVQDMTDEEIVRYVSDENNNPTLEEIKYIINRGEGIIEGHDDNPELYELFEISDSFKFVFGMEKTNK